MDSGEALEDIRGYAAARRIRLTSHGRDRVSTHGVTHEDLRYGLMNATTCEQTENGRWKVDSIDRSGDRLTAVILFWDGLLVLRVF